MPLGAASDQNQGAQTAETPGNNVKAGHKKGLSGSGQSRAIRQSEATASDSRSPSRHHMAPIWGKIKSMLGEISSQTRMISPKMGTDGGSACLPLADAAKQVAGAGRW